jgi:hypothetical protein
MCEYNINNILLESCINLLQFYMRILVSLRPSAPPFLSILDYGLLNGVCDILASIISNLL